MPLLYKTFHAFLKLIISILVISIFFSCKKDLVDSNSSVKLTFSVPSVLFDTVFTTLGSVTKWVIIYNTDNKKIKISNITLMGGANSMFSININGKYTTSASNIEIAAKDSMFLFVKVTVDPRNSNNPLIVKDSIYFNTNGNVQYLNLVAWGQDAHFIVPNVPAANGLPPYRIIAKTNAFVEWKPDKPYVIYGYAVVDSLGNLIIDAGVKVYFYNNAGLWIYRYGSFSVNGSKDNPVMFQGSRLEPAYRDIPGQWDRIWINEGGYNIINYAIIKNAFIGIQAETLSLSPGRSDLNLFNTIIENCTGIGILARNFNIKNANNCIVANCQQSAIALTLGGTYDFRNCTVGNYWSYSSRQTQSLVLNNHYSDANGNPISTPRVDLNKAYFGNCIIWGNIDEEIFLDKINTANFNYDFDHCLLKTQLNTSSTQYYQSVKVNQDPLFANPNFNDYHIPGGSPADSSGTSAILISLYLQYDLDHIIRANPPDLGAYQHK